MASQITWRSVTRRDIKSPFFALFISDFDDIFREHTAEGIPVDSRHDILCLADADDLVLLSNSAMDLEKKTRVLQQYCELNSLIINESKSKILIFHKGNLASKHKFLHENEELEIVKEFCYLGPNFSSSGLLYKAFKKQKKAALSHQTLY